MKKIDGSDGDCTACGGHGGKIEQVDQSYNPDGKCAGEWQVTGDCDTCEGTGDNSNLTQSKKITDCTDCTDL